VGGGGGRSCRQGGRFFWTTSVFHGSRGILSKRDFELTSAGILTRALGRSAKGIYPHTKRIRCLVHCNWEKVKGFFPWVGGGGGQKEKKMKTATGGRNFLNTKQSYDETKHIIDGGSEFQLDRKSGDL